MALPSYTCSRETLDRIPEVLREHGLQLEPAASECLLCGMVSRGRARVRIIGDIRPGTDRVFLMIMGTHAILPVGDTRLTKDIENILSQHGVRPEDDQPV